MAFLTLNGVAVPTAKGAEIDYVEGGSRLRTASGMQLKDVRSLKRRWKFATTPMSELRSLGIMGMLQGQGLYLPHTSASTTAANGRAPDDASGVNVRGYAAADGAPSSDENGVSDSMAPGCYSFLRETNVAPNLLTSAVAHASSLTGITFGNNASATIDSSNFWEGTTSINLHGNGETAGPFMQQTLLTGALNTTYTFSCYIKAGSATNTVTVTLTDTANSVSASCLPTAVLASSGWRRFTVSLTTPSTGATPSLQLKIATSFIPLNIYVGALQLEINSLGAFPTSFMAPGSARATGDFYFGNEEWTGAAGMTYNWWQTLPYPTPGAWSMQLLFYGANRTNGSARYSRSVTNGAATATLQFVTGDPVNNTNATGTVYTGWHMVTHVMRFDPETGEKNKSLYFDSVLKNTANQTIAGGLPDSLNNLFIGGYQTQPAFNRLADILVVPYPVDATTVGSWFTAGPGMRGATQPLLVAGGGFIGESSVTVGASIDRISTVGFFDTAAGLWRANGRVVDFALEEW